MSARTLAQAIAEAAMAALGGAARIETPALLAKLREQFPDLRAEQLGKALTGAGWKQAQWRTPTGRIRGYEPPRARAIETIAKAPTEIAAMAPPQRAPAGVGDAGRLIGAANDAPASTPFLSPGTGMSPGPLFRPGTVGPGPHAGERPPAEPCRCGSRRWWRSRFRSQGWRCFCLARPAPGEPVVVVETESRPFILEKDRR